MINLPYNIMVNIMKIKKGDYVTRKSYENDTVFLVLNVRDNICYLKGMTRT